MKQTSDHDFITLTHWAVIVFQMGGGGFQTSADGMFGGDFTGGFEV